MAVDREWASAQMVKAGVSQPVQTSVNKLLDVWGQMSHTPRTLEETLAAFTALVRSQALAADEGDPLGDWVQARPGHIVMGDTMRVKVSAYPGSKGELYNGKLGKVIGLRYGSVFLDSMRQGHKPAELEKWVAAR
jgi:hypothetical protein